LTVILFFKKKNSDGRGQNIGLGDGRWWAWSDCLCLPSGSASV